MKKIVLLTALYFVIGFAQAQWHDTVNIAGDHPVSRAELNNILNDFNRSHIPRKTAEYYGALADGSGARVSEWLIGGAHDQGYAGLAAVQVDYPHVDKLTRTIDWAALQKMANVSMGYGTSNNRRRTGLHLGRGKYMIDTTLTTGHEVSIKGRGRSESVIAATPDFPDSTWMVVASRPGIDYQHDNGLYDVGLDGGLVAYGGFWAWNTNEQGGLYHCEIKNFTDIGAQFKARDGFNDPVINFAIFDVHIVTTRGAKGCVGINIDGVNHPLMIHKGTVLLRGPTGGPGANGYGIVIKAGDMFGATIKDWHFENCVDGILVKSGRVFIENVEGWKTVLNTIHFTKGVSDVSSKIGYAKHIAIRNLGEGACIKDDNVVIDGDTLRIGRPFFHAQYSAKRYKDGLGWSKQTQYNKAPEANGTYLLAHGYERINHQNNKVGVAPQVATVQVRSSLGDQQAFIQEINDTNIVVRVRRTDGTEPGGSKVFYVNTTF